MKSAASSLLMPSCLRQAKRRLTIHDAEVHRLRAVALFRRDGIQRKPEHFGRRPAMDVFSGHERLQPIPDLRKGARRFAAPPANSPPRRTTIRLRNERAANLSSQFRAHRNVLQIGIAARQPARCRARLIEGCVQPGRLRIDQLRNHVDVRRLEFRQLPVLENQPRQRVAFREFFQHFHRRRILSGLLQLLRVRQIHLFEEDFAKLPRRVDIEFAVRFLADAPRQILNLRSHFCDIFRARTGSIADSSPLHFGQDGNQRQFDLLVDLPDLLVYLRAKVLVDFLNPGRAIAGQRAAEDVEHDFLQFVLAAIRERADTPSAADRRTAAPARGRAAGAGRSRSSDRTGSCASSASPAARRRVRPAERWKPHPLPSTATGDRPENRRRRCRRPSGSVSVCTTCATGCVLFGQVLLDQACEFQFSQQRHQGRSIRRLHGEALPIHFHRNGAIHGDELLAQQDLLAILLERGAMLRVLRLRRCVPGRLRSSRTSESDPSRSFRRCPALRERCPTCRPTDRAGRESVPARRRRVPGPCRDRRAGRPSRCSGSGSCRRADRDPCRASRRRDEGRPRRPRRDGGDNVVRFVARDATSAGMRIASQNFRMYGNLLREIRGHLLARRLVEVVLRVPQRRGGAVERDRDVVGRILLAGRASA